MVNLHYFLAELYTSKHLSLEWNFNNENSVTTELNLFESREAKWVLFSK
jgi:hypothetical protein